MFTVEEPVYKARMEQYASNGQTKELSLHEICKRRQITSANARLVCSTVLLIPTGGVTSVGVLLAIWRRRKAQKKYNILDHVLCEAALYMTPSSYVPIDDVVNVPSTELSQQAFVQAMDGSLNFMQNTTELANEGLSNAANAV
jgi:hypothetical protein